MSAGRPRAYGSSVASARKERDEDLLLFRDMLMRESERNVSLLQPVSEEFEPSQGNSLYKFPSGKRGMGHDFLTIESGKNDYDWLKTPPATPLFPSLELEANDPNMVVHKELPILEPLSLRPSRFSVEVVDRKPGPRSKCPIPSTMSTSSSRSTTPNTRPTSSSSSGSASAKARTLNPQPRTLNPKPDKRSNYHTRPESDHNSNEKPADKKEAKPRSRGLSPAVRPRLPTALPGFTAEAPPNLITRAEASRASSASRGRPGGAAAEAGVPRRQSCSPSVARGRQAGEAVTEKKGSVAAASRVVAGSRMVEKVMNARRVAANSGTTSTGREEREAKLTTSLNMATKHMEFRRSLGDARLQNMVNVKSSTITPKFMSIDSSAQSTSGQEIGNRRARFSNESRNLLKKGESRNRFGLC